MASFLALPVGALKGHLDGIAGIEYSQQRLVFDGVELDNNRQLDSYAVADGTMLHLIRRDGGTAGGGGGDGDGGGGGCRAADQAESRRLTEVADQRRTLIGVRFSDVKIMEVLGSGCNGAVFDAVVRGVPVAAKVSVCRFARHSKRVHVRLAVCTTQWKYYSKCAMERRAHAHTGEQVPDMIS